MALINCPECQTEVSDTALACPKCAVKLRELTRSTFGKIIKWLFIFFNVLMIVWLVSYWGSVGEVTSQATSSAEEAGAAIGATLGTVMLLGFWALGDIILGMMVLFTRPKA